MIKKNSPLKLVLIKQTIAHLNDEQMNSAHGGQEYTTKVTFTCPVPVEGDSNAAMAETVYCPIPG